MIVQRSIPLRVYNTHNTPQRLEGEDRRAVKAGGVVTYQIMKQNSITMQEMAEMGICMKRVLMLWGDAPDAANLSFSGLKKDGLDLLTKTLRDEVVNARFTSLSWFSIGLTLKDLMELKPSFETLVIFKVTLDLLIENKAHDIGSNWQIWFGWSQEQWKQLGFDRSAYEKMVKTDAVCSAEVRKRRLEWGPSSTD